VILLYVVVAISLWGTAAFGITRVRSANTAGLIVGTFAGMCFSILFMIKLRCAVDSYPCGFMSFTGGLTWHLLPGLMGFAAAWMLCAAMLNRTRGIGWFEWMGRIGRSMAPLLGLWIAVVWESLPVEIIHPHEFGGVCPSLPIICHDIPLMGFGGLLYWSAPFGIWAAVTIWRDISLVVDRDTGS
jgi:hypothetical protein